MGTETLVTVTFEDVDGLPADRVQMSFAALAPLGSAGVTDVINFFNATAVHDKLASYLSKTLSRAANAVSINQYALDTLAKLGGAPHGSPFQTDTFQLQPDATDIELPNQVAMVISMHADLSSVVELGAASTLPTDEAAQDEGAPATHTGVPHPRARRRGRIYFGPLDQQAKTNAGDPSSNFIADLASAAGTLLGDSVSNGWQLGVWSRRNASVVAVTGGWVDDRFDTQRRRLEGPTSRTTW